MLKKQQTIIWVCHYSTTLMFLYSEWELLCFLERICFIDLIIIVLDLPPRPNMKPSSVIQPCESPDCLTASSQCVIIIFSVPSSPNT